MKNRKLVGRGLMISIVVGVLSELMLLENVLDIAAIGMLVFSVWAVIILLGD